MIVGAALIELRVHGSRSLKEKRGVVRSVVQRLRGRFNVAVAEVGGQDTWQRAVIGLATTGIDPVAVRRVLERADAFVEGTGLCEVTNSDVEILTLEHDDPRPARHGGPDDDTDDEGDDGEDGWR